LTSARKDRDISYVNDVVSIVVIIMSSYCVTYRRR